MPRITPFLWFDTQAEEAAELYVSIFPNSRITGVTQYGEGMPLPAGTVMTAQVELDGERHPALNGGPAFPFTEAISLQIDAADQDEVDHYWSRLTDGGEESRCGWLKDRCCLSWQVVPQGLGALLADPDPGRASRAAQAM